MFPVHQVELWHLAPSGWYSGTKVPDAVETWELTVSKPSIFYLVQSRTWRCLWVSPWASREARNQLRARYPIESWRLYQVGYRIVIGEPL